MPTTKMRATSTAETRLSRLPIVRFLSMHFTFLARRYEAGIAGTSGTGTEPAPASPITTQSRCQKRTVDHEVNNFARKASDGAGFPGCATPPRRRFGEGHATQSHVWRVARLQI